MLVCGDLAWHVLADSSDLGIDMLPTAWSTAEGLAPDAAPSDTLARAEEVVKRLLDAGYLELLRFRPGEPGPTVIPKDDWPALLRSRLSWLNEDPKVWYRTTPAGEAALDRCAP